jgi:hypothetical protein
MGLGDPTTGQPTERAQWVSTLRAGAVLMLVGIPIVVLHFALWSGDEIGFLEMLTTVKSGDCLECLDRRYLLGLASLGSGLCVSVGALIEAVCVAIARVRTLGRVRNP